MNHNFASGIEYSISEVVPGLEGGNVSYSVIVKYRGRWGGAATNRRLAATLLEAERLLEEMLEQAVVATTPVFRAEHGPGQFRCGLALPNGVTVSDRVREILSGVRHQIVA